MSILSRSLALALVVAGFLVLTAQGQEKPSAAEVELKPIKYDALKAAVRAQRGKVVVVDVWADFCIPCKKAFPHLLELQHKHGKDGLICISVSVDPAAARDSALKFLKKQNATIANYWIDEKEAVWQEKFAVNGPPAVFVFDRDGRRAAKFDSDDPDKPFDQTDIDKLVQQLLKTP